MDCARDEYRELIKRVETVDPKAADYMRKEAKELPSFYPDGDLLCCFMWKETEQGHEYWESINKKLWEVES